ncbi:hypothetical protein [Bradyrhizobium sp. USDA 4452]
MKRWMAEISYNNGSPQETRLFEELDELHNIIERGPHWNTIEHIVVKLINRSLQPETANG